MPFNNTGYTPRSLEEILESMTDSARDEFGALTRTDSNSALGILLGLIAIELEKPYSDIQEIYTNSNPNSAEGRMLENVGLLGGLIRRGFSKSNAVCTFVGTTGTEIPRGTVVLVGGDSELQFSTEYPVTIPDTGSVRVELQAIKVGDITAPAGTLNQLQIPIEGVTSVTNEFDANIGSTTVESEEDFRIRRNNTLTVGGNGTRLAMESALRQLNGVTNVRIINNNRYEFVERGVGSGIYRPPATIEVVVEGGWEREILDTIALTKSESTQTFGNFVALYTDTIGNTEQIRFSRPDDKAIYVNVELTLNPEEVFPEDGTEQVKQAIVMWAEENLTLGVDLISDKLNIPIFSVDGIATAKIQVGLNAIDIGDINIIVEDFEIGKIPSENIVVTQL